MRIISLNISLPSAQRYEGREVFRGGAKKPLARAMLRYENFDGDRQADRVNHGGYEKAVCVYPFDRYPYWQRQLGRDLEPSAFSENLTISGVIETEVCVDDVFRIGETSVQVSQPRMPCPSSERRQDRRAVRKIGVKNATLLYVVPIMALTSGFSGIAMMSCRDLWTRR